MFLNKLSNNSPTLINNVRTILTNKQYTKVKQISKYFYNVDNTPRRALMYVPGDDSKKLNKTVSLDVDCIVMDCEDGVAINQKQAARNTIHAMLNAGKPKKIREYDWAVRVNSIDSGLCADDLKAMLCAKHLPDTVLLPKVDTVDHLRKFAEEISKHVKSNSINLIIYIESAMAIMNLPDICKIARDLGEQNHFAPVGLVFGGDDFLANIGASKTEDCMEILYARQKLVLVAKAFHLQAVDIVYIQYKDLDGLKNQSEQGARMGFTGKQVIHPGQVPIVQEAFLPNERLVKWATGLLKAFEVHQRSGKGAFNYEGSMIDMPTMKQAQNVINLIKSSM